jgi:hypothetical protein
MEVHKAKDIIHSKTLPNPCKRLEARVPIRYYHRNSSNNIPDSTTTTANLMGHFPLNNSKIT